MSGGLKYLIARAIGKKTLNRLPFRSPLPQEEMDPNIENLVKWGARYILMQKIAEATLTNGGRVTAVMLPALALSEQVSERVGDDFLKHLGEQQGGGTFVGRINGEGPSGFSKG